MTNLDLKEIVEGVVPLPRKGNEIVIMLAKELEEERVLHVARQEGKTMHFLCSGGSYKERNKLTFLRYDLNGNRVFHYSFKEKRNPETGIIAVGLGISAFMIGGTSAVAIEKSYPSLGIALLYAAGGITFIPPLTYYVCSRINSSRRSVKKRLKNTSDFYELKKRLIQQNIAELKKIINGIELYQGNIDEVSSDLNRTLARVETRLPEKYIQEKDNLFLRTRAYLLGADAIVHYQPGSGIGTPVRFIDKK